MTEKISAPAEDVARAEERPAPRPLYKLKLDHDDVFFGSDLLPISEADGERDLTGLGDRDVVLDHAPDNPPGMYRWSREHKRLDPLPKAQQKTEAGAPTLEQAFYALVGAALDEGALKTPLPPRLQAWLVWFEKTFDGKYMDEMVKGDLVSAKGNKS